MFEAEPVGEHLAGDRRLADFERVENAELDPNRITAVQNVALSGESFVVRVDAAGGKQYWLSSSQVLEVQSAGEVQDLVSYQIKNVSWMFSDLRDRIARAPHEMTAAWVNSGIGGAS